MPVNTEDGVILTTESGDELLLEDDFQFIAYYLYVVKAEGGRTLVTEKRGVVVNAAGRRRLFSDSVRRMNAVPRSRRIIT